MKKLLLLLLAFGSLSAAAQKKKPVPKKKPEATATVKKSLAKADGLTAEMIEKKDHFLFYTLSGNDTLFAKPIAKKDGTPTDVKITPVTASGTKLHSISWTQKKKIGDAKTKIEDITESYTEIWLVGNKNRVFDNRSAVNNISEIVWLDPNKTASKTVDKIRREGMECSVTPQGEVVLKNKSQENRLVYNSAKQAYVAKR